LVKQLLKVARQTVAFWVTELAEALPNVPMSEEVQEAEGDCLVGKSKRRTEPVEDPLLTKTK